MNKLLFTKLFETYQIPLYRYLLQMTRNKQVAEELLQETFYRAMMSLKVKNMGQARAWLFKVARNLYIDWLRKMKAEERMLEKMNDREDGVSSIGDPEWQLERKARQQELEEILMLLPERMRTILYLREIQNFSYKELGTTMNLTENQIKVTLYRARRKFRAYEMQRRKGELNDEQR